MKKALIINDSNVFLITLFLFFNHHYIVEAIRNEKYFGRWWVSLKEIPITDKASEEWLNSLKPSTRKAYKTFWLKFLQYVGMTGDQILADRKLDWEGEEYRWEKKVLQFKQWMLDLPLAKQRARCVP